MASASFSIYAYRISVSDIDLDAYATGLRLSPRFCLITAQISNDDASAEAMLSLFGYNDLISRKKQARVLSGRMHFREPCPKSMHYLLSVIREVASSIL